jgi:hypothetical protein
MNYPEKKDEKIRDIFVKDIVKDKLNVKVDPPEIQAIHRIPGKIGETRPVIVKLVNSDDFIISYLFLNLTLFFFLYPAICSLNYSFSLVKF